MKSYLFLAMLLASYLLNAQEKANFKKIGVSFSPTLKGNTTHISPFILGQNNDGKLITLRGGGISLEKYTLDVFDTKETKPESSEKFPKLFSEIGTHQIFGTYELNGVFNLITTHHDKNSKPKLYLTRINKDLSREGETEILLDPKGTDVQEVIHGITFNHDSTQILVYGLIKEKKKESLSLQWSIFDRNFKELHTHHMTLPMKSKSSEIIDIQIGANGSVYLIAAVAESKKELERGDATGMIFELDGENYESIPLGNEETMINDLLVSVSGNELLIYGLYAEKNEKGKYEGGSRGIIELHYDINKNEYTKEFRIPFSNNVLLGLTSAKAVTKGLGAPYLKIREYRKMPDGGTVVVTEQSYTYIADGSATNYKVFVNAALVLSKISSDGTLEWDYMFPKNQKAMIPTLINFGFGSVTLRKGATHSPQRKVVGFNGYYLWTIGDQVLVVYNDNPENQSCRSQNQAKDFQPGVGKRCINIAMVDEAGKMQKRALVPWNESTKSVMNVLGLYKVNDREIIFFCAQAGVKEAWGTINVK